MIECNNVSGGKNSFITLTDAPTSYGSQTGKGVRVNAGENALEFYTLVDTDEHVKYAADDTAAGYLGAKTVAGTGISLAEGTGGDADKLVVTNSMPDQTVAISAGSGIGVSGTYPSFTVSNTGVLAEADTLASVVGRGANAGATVNVGAGNALTLAAGSITDGSGALSFGNENLSTSGTLGAGATTVTSLTDSGLTLGSIPFAGTGGLLSQSVGAGQQLFWDNTNFRLGIGTASPSWAIDIIKAGVGVNQAAFSATTYANLDQSNGDRALLVLNRARGTIASPLKVENNDWIGSFQANAYNGSSFYNIASIFFQIDGSTAASPLRPPGRIVFNTANTSQTLAERWRIDNAGNLSNTGADGTAYLHLKAGTATAGTAPLKFTAGIVTTAAVAGQVEFATANSDNLTFCITTGPARKNFVLDDGTALVTGRVPYTGTNGRLLSTANLLYAGTDLTLASTNKLIFNASTEYINSANAGYLDLNAATGIRLNTAVTLSSITTVGGTAPVADGTYTVGARLTPVTGIDGTITVKSGIITAIQPAT